MITVRPAMIEDAVAVAENMRVCDKIEVWLTAQMTPSQATMSSYWSSSVRRTMEINGKPIAIYGVSWAPGQDAVVWLLGTKDIAKNRKEFHRVSRKQIVELMEIFPVMSNWVYSRNETSIRWLKRLGAYFDPPIEFGPYSQQFARFEFRRV